MVAVSGVYANAIVSIGGGGSRVDCGSTWKPNAVTSARADALKQRAWTAAALLGVGLLATTGAVVVAGRWPGGFLRQVPVLAGAAALAVTIAGLVWAGVIDRTVGT